MVEMFLSINSFSYFVDGQTMFFFLLYDYD
jgi:hypothetical protein